VLHLETDEIEAHCCLDPENNLHQPFFKNQASRTSEQSHFLCEFLRSWGWRVYRVKRGLFGDPRQRRFEPFSFGDARQIREIEMTDQALHIYQNEFSNEIQEPFLQVALEAIRQRENK